MSVLFQTKDHRQNVPQKPEKRKLLSRDTEVTVQHLYSASSLFVPIPRLSVRTGQSSDHKRFIPHVISDDIGTSRTAIAND